MVFETKVRHSLRYTSILNRWYQLESHLNKRRAVEEHLHLVFVVIKEKVFLSSCASESGKPAQLAHLSKTPH